MTIVTSSKGFAYKHFILTRFWFARGPSGVNAPTSDARQWLEDRLKLFNSYCLPSVVGQSCQDFKWLISLDALTPADFLARMRRLVSPWNNIEILVRDEWGPTLRSDIANGVAGKTEWVLTTRFDSDDGLHRDFVKRLHEAIGDPVQEFLNFPNGILIYRNNCYLYQHLSNAFISLLEPVDTVKTVFWAPHERVNEVGPVRQLSPAPAFLQVVHGTNDSNKPRGYRVHKILALQGFEAVRTLHDPPLEESNAEILLDNAIWGSLWFVRDRLADQMKSFRRGLQRRGSISKA